MPLRVTHFAAAVSLSAAFAVNFAAPGAALADDLTVTGISQDISGSPAGVLTVPSVDVVDGNLDEATIRSIFATGFAGSAPALAKLDASAITIPLFTISTKDAPFPLLIARNIAFKDVKAGVAGSVSVGDIELTIDKSQNVKLGTVAADQLNIANLLGLSGLVALADPTTPQPVYSGLSVEGLEVHTTQVSCVVKPMTLGALAARPLKPESMAALKDMSDKSEKGPPNPVQAVAMAKAYADLLTAYSVGAANFSGFNCDGIDPEGKPLTVALGQMTQGEMTPGHSPEVNYSGLDVERGTDGYIKLGTITLKPIDFSAPLALVQEQGEALTFQWLTANVRKLIPAFDGFSLSNFDMDMVGQEPNGERQKVAIGNFDLSLADYVNGIPADIRASVAGLHVALPPTPDNQALMDMGYGEISGGIDVAIHWDRDAGTIVVDKLATTWDNAAAVSISATFGNATPDLFSDTPMVAMQAAQHLTLKSLSIDLTDAGLLPKALAIAAGQQGVDPQSFRTAIAAMAQGTVIVGLAGSPDSITVSQALTDFISGTAPHIALTATALDPNGLSLADLQDTQTNPNALLQKIKLTATTAETPAAAEEAPVKKTKDLNNSN